ncbi:ribose-5-phosphate isomerase RpiA [Methanolobus zinderi]|jgi:ribose 5-phosphate isomerase A|uniref:Ribose-5-phosphate isomerase A n=1 Tax=Methanolobus zinderi TaxID=536044 RepID=A0A7D5IP75_9EURY|nr:ribose-5-phosphate isomerase RpiA [Methanolobus zinderi]QLC50085.1 ribose-5-phosphate isomerase RpiA [Methanolobus zinderi]
MKERNPSGESPEKKAAGIAAAELVQDGMVVGLGTGSTTAYTIAELGRRVDEGLDIIAVVTSYQSEMLAIEAGITLTSLAEHPELDIAIDGADQINSALNVIKGGGAAHTREKVVSRSAERFVIVADESKYSEQLDHYVPLEVLPYAKELVSKHVRKLGGEPVLRLASKKDGPVISDNGNFIIDASFGVIDNPVVTSALLSQAAGIVEHGIFTNVDEVYIGKKDGSVQKLS